MDKVKRMRLKKDCSVHSLGNGKTFFRRESSLSKFSRFSDIVQSSRSSFWGIDLRQEFLTRPVCDIMGQHGKTVILRMKLSKWPEN